MIIRKITEVTETQTTETFQLICHEKDEGWELTREEMEKLKNMTERSLEDFYGRREKETVPAELYDDFYRKYTLDCYQLENKYRQEELDLVKKCPDYIEPQAPEVVCENGSCTLVIPDEVSKTTEKVTESSENLTKTEEKEPKPREKEQRLKPQTGRDYSVYINMLVNDEEPGRIRKMMMEDLGITEGTANAYYYNKVRPEAELIKAAKEEQEDPVKEFEKEKKALEKELEAKVERKYFSDEDRERIRRQLGLK